MSDDTGFDVVGDDMDLVITDVVILNKKERAMPNYLSVSVYCSTFIYNFVRSTDRATYK